MQEQPCAPERVRQALNAVEHVTCDAQLPCGLHVLDRVVYEKRFIGSHPSSLQNGFIEVRLGFEAADLAGVDDVVELAK